MSLKNVIDEYMLKVSGIDEHCDRCLKTERWDGHVVLMVVDAAFTSIGLNYFTAIVPKVNEFYKKFVETGKIPCLNEIKDVDVDELRTVWRNTRSWLITKEIARHLSNLLSVDDKTALRLWARKSNLEHWEEDPIGKIKGVGLVTFQYLRMMGGIDTVMPDKIVKRVINKILENTGYDQVNKDLEFVRKAEKIAISCGYRPIELCWMTWLIQPEGKLMRMDKYSDILSKI